MVFVFHMKAVMTGILRMEMAALQDAE